MGFLSKVLSVAGPIVGAVVGGPAGAAIGSAASGLAAGLGAEEANAATAASTREQMAFQERMSSTAVQRRVQILSFYNSFSFYKFIVDIPINLNFSNIT